MLNSLTKKPSPLGKGRNMPVACFWCKRWMRFYEEEYFFFYEYNEAKDVPHFYKWGWYI